MTHDLETRKNPEWLNSGQHQKEELQSVKQTPSAQDLKARLLILADDLEAESLNITTQLRAAAARIEPPFRVCPREALNVPRPSPAPATITTTNERTHAL
jgi:hypothetical protein